jgi:DNA polymerase-3 subunit beta
MKLRIPKSQLRMALDKVTACVARTNTLPILDYVLIEPIQGALRISGSNLEITQAVDIPLDGIEQAQSWTAPAHKLKAIAAAAPDQEIACSVGDNSITLTSGSSRWRLPTLPAEQWPERQDHSDLQEISIGAETLRRMIAATLPAAAKNEARYYLNGINLESQEGSLTACGTDAHRLHAAEAIGDYPGGISLILPRQAAQIIDSALPVDGDVLFSYGPGIARVSYPGVSIETKLVDGRYPDWRRIIPSHENACLVDGKMLIEAINRAALTANQHHAIRLDFNQDHIVVAASSVDGGESSDRVEAEYDGNATPFGVNSIYMVAALTAISGVVRIGITDSEKSILIEPADPSSDEYANLFAVVVPVRL